MTETIIYRRSFDVLVQRESVGWERIVTGVVADPKTVDSYGNIIGEETIRQAAYDFMEYFQNMGTDHTKDQNGNPVILNDLIHILESWVTHEDSVINGREVPKGSWVLTVRVIDDQIWNDILNGEYIGFSLEALCNRIPLVTAA